MKKRPLLAALALAVAFGFPPAEMSLPRGSASPIAWAEPALDTPGSQSAAPLTARATRELLETVVPPARDEADLARRFKQACGAPVAAPVPARRDETEGESRAFWVLDEPSRSFFHVQGTLALATKHLLFYVQDGVPVKREALEASARIFESKTYPLLRQYFGDLGYEPQITVFNGRIAELGGYFSSSDMLPKDVNPYSNERPMVFMSVDAYRPGTPGYDSVLAHEMQHFIHHAVHPQQDSWINEGASELAMALFGDDRQARVGRYLATPETQLNAWTDAIRETAPHYGGGYLMLEYFAQRAGGYSAVKDLIAAPGVSVRTFDSYFEQVGSPLRFASLFRDFVVANLLNDRSVAGGRFGYEKLSLKARVQETVTTFPARSAATLRPFATRYIEYQPGRQRGTLDLRFQGAPAARLFGADARSGRAQWWGNAADNMESTLTRSFDLTGVARATLRYAVWFDTERAYDYAGVAVSTDNGCTWRTLAGRHTTDEDPTGQNPGHAYNGRSGGGESATWVDEAIDLSEYAGKPILIRFFNITDQSYHGSGIAVDDISIPEIGFMDDAETDAGWQARGFVRSANAATVDWAVQVIAFGDGPPQVLQLAVPVDGEATEVTGTLSVPQFGSSVNRVVVAVSPLVPVTLQPVDFGLEAMVRG